MTLKNTCRSFTLLLLALTGTTLTAIEENNRNR